MALNPLGYSPLLGVPLHNLSVIFLSSVLNLRTKAATCPGTVPSTVATPNCETVLTALFTTASSLTINMETTIFSAIRHHRILAPTAIRIRRSVMSIRSLCILFASVRWLWYGSSLNFPPSSAIFFLIFSTRVNLSWKPSMALEVRGSRSPTKSCLR